MDLGEHTEPIKYLIRDRRFTTSSTPPSSRPTASRTCAARYAAPGDSLERQSQRAYMLLDGRARWGGRSNPLLWRSGDVHGVPFDIAVRKLTDVSGLAEHGVETLRAYLEYLEQEDRFHAS